MDTPVLKRRLNPFLLASTVLVLSLLAGLSVMYQGQLSQILNEKQGLQEQLEERNARINTLEQRVTNLTNETSQLQRDVQRYVSRSEDLEATVDSLNNEIDTLEDEKEELNEEISVLENQTEELNDTVNDINWTLEDVCEDDDNNLTEGSETLCELEGHEP